MASFNGASSAGPRDRAAASYRSAVGEVPDVLELVADVCQAPMAALKVADQAQAHFAATWGLAAPMDVPKSRSLCDMVSTSHDAMVVDDAPQDPRLADHPLVSGAAHVRFIAAAPLHHDGYIVGALCVFDNARRRIDADTTRRYLERIARRVDAEAGLRHLLASSPLALIDSDDVVAAVSHEFRTPLTAIQGNVELLADTSGAIAPAYARQFEAINRNAKRLGRTIETILRAVDQRRHEPVGVRRTHDLASVAAAAIASFGLPAGRVMLDAPALPVLVSVDASLLEVAVGHLLNNALAFSRPDGTVALSITDRDRPTLEIRDQGPGVDGAELARLGTPFFRGARAHQYQLPGVGLGLTVADGIIRAQSAELGLFSSADGFTARITFL